MARNTRAKKQAEAPKVDIGAEIFASLRELEKIKGYSDDNLRTSVVSKLTAKELKQLFHSRNCIGKLNLIENNKK